MNLQFLNSVLRSKWAYLFKFKLRKSNFFLNFKFNPIFCSLILAPSNSKKAYNAKISLSLKSSVSEISHSSKTKHRIRTGIVEIERAEKSRSHSDNFSKPYLYSLASYEPSKFGLRYWCCQNRCMIFEFIIELKTYDPITEL